MVVCCLVIRVCWKIFIGFLGLVRGFLRRLLVVFIRKV